MRESLDIETGSPPEQQQQQPPTNSTFTDKVIRDRFIRKVHGILSVQFLIVFGVCALFTFVDRINTYVTSHWWPILTSIVVYFHVIILIIFCKQLRRTVPWNYIFLFTQTLCMSVMIGIFCALIHSLIILLGVGIIFSTTCLVAMLTFFRKFDITKLIYICLVCMTVLLFAGIAAAIYHTVWLHALYAGAGALFCVLFLVLDVNATTYEPGVTEEEYIFVVLKVFTDMIYVFFYILISLGGR